jgi:hypothetical protein
VCVRERERESECVSEIQIVCITVHISQYMSETGYVDIERTQSKVRFDRCIK